MFSWRHQSANYIHIQKEQALRKIISPVKKNIVAGIFDYLTEMASRRDLISLSTTNFSARNQNINELLKNIDQLSDDKFLAYARQYVTEQIESSSQFRQCILQAVDTAQKDLQTRRESNQRMILGLCILSCIIDPSIGIPICGIMAVAHLSGHLSYQSLCNELLEFYENTSIKSEEGFKTSYYKLNNRV